MNLGRALFLHDLITDEEIDICSHIFHILSKTTERTASRNCLPLYCFISKNLKFKGILPLENEYPYPKQSPINIHTLNAIICHSRKGVKQESHAPHGTSSSSSHPCDEKLDNIMASVQDISTKLFGLATIMHSQRTCFDTKFTSLQTQLDQIQRRIEEDEGYKGRKSPPSSCYQQTSRSHVFSNFSDPAIRPIASAKPHRLLLAPKLLKLQNTLYTLKRCELYLGTNLFSRYDNGRGKEKRLQ